MSLKKTSILFVTSGKQEQSHWQVPTSVIRNWKKIIFGFVLSIFALIGVIATLVYLKTGSHYENQIAQANQRFLNITKMVNVHQLQKSFHSIDSSLYEINRYLKERGIEQGKVQSVGGEGGFEIDDVNAVADYYESYLKDLTKKIKFTPIGFPIIGEQTSHFGYRADPFGGGTESHPGIDFRGDIGDPVKVTADGKVSFCGLRGGYGNCVEVTHGNGFSTLYGHLSAISVKPDQQLKAGEKIGLVGSTGRSTGPHLHYEVLYNGKRINPEQFLKL
jgi:murein DD-endopeptidase MepM/ murein hydrolase activator NlpD